jgi:DNA repair protein RecO (recombination protein O)
MSRSYKTTGINLKVAPMGEADRLVTLLTLEHGLIRAIAPGARKHHSKLGGRSGLFVINELVIAPGKSLDKIVQAETQRSFPGLSQTLAKLTASQYLAELTLCEAQSEQPQASFFYLLVEHLERLEQASTDAMVLACLAHATFHILAIAGVAPEVYQCCVTRADLVALASPLVAPLPCQNWND